ncbi:MAG: flagellar basal body L-ring protein FlgH [Nitrospinae bacterium]|nr:flagellar basal body L-ring protein FlgH [Nitrospinota bacterium]
MKLIILLAAGGLLASCAAKTIPEPVIPEAEPVKVSSTEGSLWPGENSKNSFFSDNKALRTGDLIVVHLVEKTTAANRTGVKTNRQVKDSIGISTGGTSAPTTINVGGGENFAGSGDNSRSDALTSTVSAMIMEVFPNGNMKIYGRRKLKINNEDQYVAVAGIIRPEDVNFDNSIVSTKIANADITYDGVGDLNDSNRSGWVGRALHSIWPF